MPDTPCADTRCGTTRPRGGRAPRGMVRIPRADLSEQTRIYCSTICANAAAIASARADLRAIA